jgi:hypothetical protein
MMLPAKKFFDSPEVLEYIKRRKTYKEAPDVTFHHQSYEEPIDETELSFDLLISQYGGFVSEVTKKYLKKGGILLANDSHGDAGLAFIDPDFKLIGIFEEQNGIYVLSAKDLDLYFIPKKGGLVSREYLRELRKGVLYTKNAPNYIFEKVA